MSTGKILGDRFKVGQVIGHGAFSTVHECHDIESGVRYAVKVVSKQRLQSAEMEEAFEREAMALRSLGHSRYVTVAVDILQSTRNYYVIMDLADRGSLLQLVVKTNGGNGLPNHAVRRYFVQLLHGLRDMHDADIVHRDIKPENLLLDAFRNVKISDFGFAAKASSTRMLRRQCGTPQYVAPEVILGEGYIGQYADIWSTGVTLYVLLCGQLPFAAPDHDRLYDQILAGKYPPPRRPEGLTDIPPAALHLLKCCLCLEPSKRWSAEKLLKHPYLLGMDDVVVEAGASVFSSIGASLDVDTLPFDLTADSSLVNASMVDLKSPLGPPQLVRPRSKSVPDLRELEEMGQYIHQDPQLGRRYHKRNGNGGSLEKNGRSVESHDDVEDAASSNDLVVESSRREGLGLVSDLSQLRRLPSAYEFLESSSNGTSLPPNGSTLSESALLNTSNRVSTGVTPIDTTMHSPSRTPLQRPPSRPQTTPHDPARFTKPIQRRFGLVHVLLVFNFLFVCLVVLLVASLKIMFDIKLERLPKRVRDMVEALVDGIGLDSKPTAPATARPQAQGPAAREEEESRKTR